MLRSSTRAAMSQTVHLATGAPGAGSTPTGSVAPRRCQVRGLSVRRQQAATSLQDRRLAIRSRPSPSRQMNDPVSTLPSGTSDSQIPQRTSTAALPTMHRRGVGRHVRPYVEGVTVDRQ